MKAIETARIDATASTLDVVSEPIQWMGTREACERLGVTLRTLYRFIDEGQLPAYKMGRVIRLQASDVDAFIDRMRIQPGSLEHLYPEPRSPAGGHGGPDRRRGVIRTLGPAGR